MSLKLKYPIKLFFYGDRNFVIFFLFGFFYQIHRPFLSVEFGDLEAGMFSVLGALTRPHLQSANQRTRLSFMTHFNRVGE